MRQLAGRFVLPENNYTGGHGCIHTAASFIAWNQVDGDYLEFGVFRGESFSAAFKAIERNRRVVGSAVPRTPAFERWFARSPRYFAFDSFAGLPEGHAARHADYAAGAYACPEPQFLSNIAADGVDLSRVTTVAGMYDQSLVPELKPRIGLTQAAMVFIDCDLYESTVPVLEFITDLLGQGTIIVFHDWFRFKGSPMHGEQRACAEWLRRNPQLELIEYWREGPQAVSFLVNMKNASGRADATT
ncbi:MAG: TylF/MycF/NovP-related O-methyltransferase [Burkholderiales bacterium]